MKFYQNCLKSLKNKDITPLYRPCHRTTVAHFLNKGKWDDSKREDILKSTMIQIIYQEALRSRKPVFYIVDDTISSKTKPSSRALHPIEDTYFHQFHLKGKQDYGHQAVSVMLSCNIRTDVSLSTKEIRDKYSDRWSVEVFFRQPKDKLSFDRYQIRSSKGIRRYWLLMSLAHVIACTSNGETMSFGDGYSCIYSQIQRERIHFIYQFGARHILFDEVLALTA